MTKTIKYVKYRKIFLSQKSQFDIRLIQEYLDFYFTFEKKTFDFQGVKVLKTFRL